MWGLSDFAKRVVCCGAIGAAWLGSAWAEETNPRQDALSAEVWRREQRIVDLHTHIENRPDRYERAIRIFDAVGVGTAIELGSGTLTPVKGGPSEFEEAVATSEKVCPGRFLHYMLIDYAGWDDPDWSEKAVAQVDAGFKHGAVGLKEFKRLGLSVRDGRGNLIKIDDPQLDPVWKRCGELGMPVSIHVGDPQAFWEPLNEQNERWDELRDHPHWWFGDPKKYPPRLELLEAMVRMIERNPQTTFVCVHFGNNSEDVDWVDRQLDAHPNMMIDLAARIPEIGRGDQAATDKLRRFFVKHQDRIFFGTDFQVASRLTLGSAGDAERPTDYDGVVFYQKCYRFFETSDRDWAHMTPIQGKWTISSIDLPAEVQRKVYFDNARKLLARSFPAPTICVSRISQDFVPDGKLTEEMWKDARAARIEYGLQDAKAYPSLSTSVRALWSDKYLYLAFEAPYTELTMEKMPGKAERLGLWENDVVEFFVSTNATNPHSYSEYEWAPNGEQLDVKIDLPKKDFEWSSQMESAAVIDRDAKVWRVEARIPLTAIGGEMPKAGTRWRANLYRHDVANKVFLAWNPTLATTAHEPSRFGWLAFTDE